MENSIFVIISQDIDGPWLAVPTSWHLTSEPPRGKTNNVVSEQVRHKPACTSTEKS